jgi:drug/metabolite transporter (DMT)-like permease
LKINNYRHRNNENKIHKGKENMIFNKSYMIMILALISCFLWGSAFPSVKLGYKVFSIRGSDTFQVILFAGYRFLVSAIMIFAFCIITRRKSIGTQV